VRPQGTTAPTGSTRRCIRCDQDLPLAVFGLTPAGNPRSWCKPCHRAYKAAWKKTDRGRELERRERQRNGRARRERFKQRNPDRYAEISRRAHQKYVARHKDRLREKSRRFHRQRPEVYWAGRLVHALLFFKMLVRRPCEACGTPKAQAHHPDHWIPLAIVWLCSRCHGRLGSQLKRPEEAHVEKVKECLPPPSRIWSAES